MRDKQEDNSGFCPNSLINIGKSISQLQQKIKDLENKNKHLLEINKSLSQLNFKVMLKQQPKIDDDLIELLKDIIYCYHEAKYVSLRNRDVCERILKKLNIDLD